MTDYLTVLECTEGHRCAKLYTDPGQKPEPYDAGYLFTPHRVVVASLAELAEQLETLRRSPRCMLIRDALRADAQPSPLGLVARRRVDRPGDPAPFEHAAHHWAMFDADATAAPFDPADPQGSVTRWKAALPGPLAKAKAIFQFSASQHLSPTVRGHLFVWLAEPLGNVPLARWSIRNGLDPAVFHAVQPLYTADPLFAEGIVDPLEPRALVMLDGAELCEPDLQESDFEERGALDNAGQRRSPIALEEIGEPCMLEPAAEARERIATNLARAFEGPGKRWDLCGHIGGACANAGLPPEECCAILEALRAPDVHDHEFGAGLKWALGAYSFSARPLGLKGMRELLGPITTTRIGEGFATLAMVYEPPAESNALDKRGEDWGGLPFELFDTAEEPAALEYTWRCFAAGKVSAIVGYPYTSKTPLALDLAISIAAGVPCQGSPTRQGRVLYIATEGARNARRKAARIAKAKGLTLTGIGRALDITPAPSGYLNAETCASLCEVAVAKGYAAVFLDTYGSALDGSIERNAAPFSDALKQLGDCSDATGVLFVVLLHCRKDQKTSGGRAAPSLQQIDGHNSVGGAVQAAVGLWRPDEADKYLVEVVCVRAVDDAFNSYCVRWTDTPGSGGNGLRAELVDSAGSAVVSSKHTEALGEANTERCILGCLRNGNTVPLRYILKDLSTGQGPADKQAVAWRMHREGLIVIADPLPNGSQVVSLAPRSVASTNAEAKRQGFLKGKP